LCENILNNKNQVQDYSQNFFFNYLIYRKKKHIMVVYL